MYNTFIHIQDILHLYNKIKFLIFKYDNLLINNLLSILFLKVSYLNYQYVY